MNELRYNVGIPAILHRDRFTPLCGSLGKMRRIKLGQMEWPNKATKNI